MAGKTLSPDQIQQSPFVKVFNCSHCGSSVKISALGVSIMAVCSSCGTAVDTTDENLRVLSKFTQNLFYTSSIPIGSRGKLHGTLWEVIGFMERSDTHSFYWHEYLLFNPQKGFRWLAENSGHWSWIVSVKDKPVDHGSFSTYRNKSYQLFHQGRAQICYVRGEFYWRAQLYDITRVKDFIRAPEILSVETTATEVNWSIGEYIEAETIKKAFKLESMPTPQGVAPNQLWKNAESYTSIKWTWALMVGILLLFQFIRIFSTENKLVFDYSGEHTRNVPSIVRPNVTEPFQIIDSVGNLELYVRGNLHNNWIELQVELVNDDTGESREFEFGAEWYYGNDGGESWSEGSQSAKFLIPSIPRGNYHINFTTASDSVNPVSYQFKGFRDVLVWSDFLWSFALISLFPILLAWRNRSFEMRRWQNSDYSPYHGADDE